MWRTQCIHWCTWSRLLYAGLQYTLTIVVLVEYIIPMAQPVGLGPSSSLWLNNPTIWLVYGRVDEWQKACSPSFYPSMGRSEQWFEQFIHARPHCTHHVGCFITYNFVKFHQCKITSTCIWDERLRCNASMPVDANKRQWNGLTLLQIMACHKIGAMLLLEPMLTYCPPGRLHLSEIGIKILYLSFKEIYLKMSSANGGYFSGFDVFYSIYNTVGYNKVTYEMKQHN